MYSNAVVLESQPDWLTAATHREKNTRELRRLALAWQADEVKAGNRLRPWRLMGYQGYMAGRVRVGERQNACLVQLSGDLAATHLSAVRELEDSLTRIDIATTVQLPAYDPDAGTRGYAAALAFRAGSPRLALPKLVQDGNGGSTLYIGDRTSDYLLRVYNKQAEREADHDPEGAVRYARCWRYELECKGEPAPQLAKLVDESTDRAGYVQAFIHQHAVNHGLTPLFPPNGQQAIRPGFTRRADREKTLAWFRKSVGPAVARLLAQGDESAVYTALGIPIPPAPAPTETKS